jgi:hypothetical protein
MRADADNFALFAALWPISDQSFAFSAQIR